MIKKLELVVAVELKISNSNAPAQTFHAKLCLLWYWSQLARKEMINQAMGSDDFSFPTTTGDSPPRFMESPPLWRTFSTTVFAREDRDRGGPKGEDREGAHFPIGCSQRKSFSCIERGAKGSMEYCSDGDEEEKMDVLWEDFMNEEFSRSTCGLELDLSPGKKVELGCVQALRLSRTGGGGVLSGKRRPGVLVFMKVLRKLFLLHNSNRKANKHPW